jgi:hypothetical protein
MPMTAIAQDGRRRSYLVYGYSQGHAEYNYKDIGPWGAVRNGYCAALGFVWIKARLAGGDLPFDAATQMAEKADWTVTRLHNLTKQLGYPPVMAELGLKGHGPLALGAKADAETVFAHVKEQDYGCYRLSFRRDGGGHLVVMQKEARVHGSGPFASLMPTYRYFDANHGHFRFPSGGAFISWFRTFLTDSGYQARYTKPMQIELVTKA